MKIPSRTGALVVGVGLVAAVVILREPAPPGDRDLVSAGLEPASLLHIKEAAGEGQEAAGESREAAGEGQESGDAAEQGQGETAAEAAVYAAEQGQAEQPPQWQAIADHENATRGPEQPIPFNHRFHVTDLGISCEYCHIGTETSVSGVVPALEVCLGCHRVAGTGLPPIEELRAYAARNEPVPWKWVNKLPEFVQFSHRPHLRNNIACAECHGPVERMDRVYQWASLQMGWCLECHRQPPRETDVATDHVLSTIEPPPPSPGGDQEASAYPLAIDSQYGAHRGPIDCAACHY